MSATSELILAPAIDQQALKKSADRLTKAMGDASDKLGKQTEKEIKEGSEKGLKDGFSSGGGFGLNKLKTGLVAVIAAAGAAVTHALSGIEDDINRVIERLNQSRDVSQEAGAFNISAGSYAQINAIMTAAGYDIGDTRGMLSGFQASLNDPEMAEFKKIADRDGVLNSMLDYIKSAGNMSQTDRAGAFQLFGDDDAVKAMNLLKMMGSSTDLQTFFTGVTGSKATEQQLTEALKKAGVQTGIYNQAVSQAYIDDLIRSGQSGQGTIAARNLKLDRSLEAAQETLLPEKMQLKELKVTAEISTINATKATIVGAQDAFKGLKDELLGLNPNAVPDFIKPRVVQTKSQMELTRMAGSVEQTPQEIWDEFTGLVRDFRDWIGNAKEDKSQQDYSNSRGY